MRRWLRRIGICLLVLALAVVGGAVFVRAQGIQWLIALQMDTPTYRDLPRSGCPVPVYASAPITVLTYNVFNGSALVERLADRFAGGNLQGMRPWSARLPEIRERIAEYDPDLIGFQEFGAHTDVLSALPDPAAYTLVSFKAGPIEYGDAALLVRTRRFAVEASGQFWLSPTPQVPMAFGFQRASMPRYVNWALLWERGRDFRLLFVNTHFDNNPANKEPSADLFHGRVMPAAAGWPTIITGDFNSNATTDRYTRLGTGLRNTFDLAAEPRVWKPEGALRAVLPGDRLSPEHRIDHIFVGLGPGEAHVEDWFIDLRPMRDGAPLSDHDPMVARIRFDVREIPNIATE